MVKLLKKSTLSITKLESKAENIKLFLYLDIVIKVLFFFRIKKLLYYLNVISIKVFLLRNFNLGYENHFSKITFE